MLSRKHYKQLANVIKVSEYRGIILKKVLLDNLCIVLKQDNTRFNSDKFIDACNDE